MPGGCPCPQVYDGLQFSVLRGLLCSSRAAQVAFKAFAHRSMVGHPLEMEMLSQGASGPLEPR